MNQNTDFFLSSFANTVKEKDSSLLFDCLDTFQYNCVFSMNSLYSLLKERKEVLDKIVKITKSPAILVKEEEVIKLSSLAGKLTSSSLIETMQDPKLWKEKEKEMVPYFVHAKETDDTILRYENAFICLLIKEIEKDISSYDSLSLILCEGLEDHYQSKENSYGPFSVYHDLRKRTYPYQFFFVREGEKRNEVLLLLQNCRKKIKNLKETPFYRINSKVSISKNIYPTNILLHDKVYNYCYRYYLEKRKHEDDFSSKDYETYAICCFLKALKDASLLNRDNMPSLSFDSDRKCHFTPFSFFHYPFVFQAEEARQGIRIKVLLKDEEKEIASSLHLLYIVECYSKDRNYFFKKKKEELEKEYQSVTFLAKENEAKEYSSLIHLTPYKKGGIDLLLDYLSSLTMLFKASFEYYSQVCPLCSSKEIAFDGKEFHCLQCGCQYSLFSLDKENLLYLRKGRKD